MSNGDAQKTTNHPNYAHDPNFPLDLRITPSSLSRKKKSSSSQVVPLSTQLEHSFDTDSQQDIEAYGIAGRIWEAAYALKLYLQPEDTFREISGSPELGNGAGGLQFEPPCSLFNRRKKRRITAFELGSGAGYAGLHLARTLSISRASALSSHSSIGSDKEINSGSTQDTVILTDLDNVCPLLCRNASRASHSHSREFNLPNQTCEENESNFTLGKHLEIKVRPLSWGNEAQAVKILEELKSNQSNRVKEKDRHPLTHLILSDLVYFPELLPPLLRSVISLTEPLSRCTSQEDLELKTPEMIIAYKIRSLVKEEPFWRALGSWFDFQAVDCTEKDSKEKRWRRFGKEFRDLHPSKSNETQDEPNRSSEEPVSEEQEGDEIYIFIARRKLSSIGCLPPQDDLSLMSGKRIRLKTKRMEGEEDKSNNSREHRTEIEIGEVNKTSSELDDEVEKHKNLFEEEDGGEGDGFELMLLGDMEI